MNRVNKAEQDGELISDSRLADALSELQNIKGPVALKHQILNREFQKAGLGLFNRWMFAPIAAVCCGLFLMIAAPQTHRMPAQEIVMASAHTQDLADQELYDLAQNLDVDWNSDSWSTGSSYENLLEEL